MNIINQLLTFIVAEYGLYIDTDGRKFIFTDKEYKYYKYSISPIEMVSVESSIKSMSMYINLFFGGTLVFYAHHHGGDGHYITIGERKNICNEISLNDNSIVTVNEIMQKELSKLSTIYLSHLNVERAVRSLRTTSIYLDFRLDNREGFSVQDHIVKPLKDVYGERVRVGYNDRTNDGYRMTINVMDKMIERPIEMKEESLLTKWKRKVLRK